MQSTFSAISTGQESVTYDEEEDEDEADHGQFPLASAAPTAGSNSPL